MEAALAELTIEDVKDEADDKDFIIVRGKHLIIILPFLITLPLADEEDVFGSDFESTDEDEEATQQTSDAGERQVKVEERREKKVRFLSAPLTCWATILRR
jgi:hypothetical protein